jgi:hypothetical protein
MTMTRTQFRDSLYAQFFVSARRDGMSVREAEAFAERQTGKRMRAEALLNLPVWSSAEYDAVLDL